MSATRLGDRCTIEVHLSEEDLAEALRRDVREGLTATPKRIPPKWFYDERGSLLFDDITRLPEYYPTRRETEILQREAVGIAERTGATVLVELGSGTSTKTRLLLDALFDARTLDRVVAFDVCEPVLATAGPQLAERYAGVEVQAVVGDFEHHLGKIDTGGTALIAFLGGTIGNQRPAERAQFLADLAGHLDSGDWLLLGTDLVKDPARLVAAYDDAAGVTAEFNRNVLHIVNRELGGDLAPYRFDHVARWNREEQWIEMHLRAHGAQKAHLDALALDLDFEDGEMIHTEISAKFTRTRVQEELVAAGLELAEIFTDPDGDFAVSLARKP